MASKATQLQMVRKRMIRKEMRYTMYLETKKFGTARSMSSIEKKVQHTVILNTKIPGS